MNSTTNLPRYSIIVPVYNVADYLPECVDSLLAQDTATPYEILLVDDGSTDSSGSICDAYADKDARVRVIHKSNGGVSSARNTGISTAKGDYYLFVDPDDWCSSDLLAKVSQEILESPLCDMVLYGAEVFGEAITPSLLLPNVMPQGESGPTYLERLNQIGETPFPTVWSYAYRAEFLRKSHILFNEGYPVAEDVDFIMNCMIQAATVTSIPIGLYHYRIRPGSLVRTFSAEKEKVRLSISEKWFDRIPTHSRANHYVSVVIAVLDRGGIKTIKTSPLRWDIMKCASATPLRVAASLFRILGFNLGWPIFCILRNIRKMQRKVSGQGT